MHFLRRIWVSETYLRSFAIIFAGVFSIAAGPVGPAPVPQARPSDIGDTKITAPVPEVPPAKEPASPQTAAPQTAAPQAAPPLCPDQLRALGGIAEIEALQPEGACSVDQPVRLTAIMTSFGRVELPDRPVLACAFSLVFTDFVQENVAALAKGHVNTALKSMSTGPGYVCRQRYNRPGEKLSEHGKGNAVDIASFTFTDASQLAVSVALAGETNEKKAFLRALRQAACGYFTTVLGPGSNEDHANHLHFDLQQHGSSARYRLCE